MAIEHSQLGKLTEYPTLYDPTVLFPIARATNRQLLGLTAELPFHGIDLWNAYELSWLDPQGKPIVAQAEFSLPYDTPNLVESKSIKLYFNSFNQTKFTHREDVAKTIAQDLSAAAGSAVNVKLLSLTEATQQPMGELTGRCLDELDVSITDYHTKPSLLTVEENFIEETLVSHLLKSNCPVTSQPDWGSVQIHYQGKKINPVNLLKYIISFRQHDEFHEQCVERMFVDIMRYCAPEKLSVYARYTRRGGLDINPFRSNFATSPINQRIVRQ